MKKSTPTVWAVVAALAILGIVGFVFSREKPEEAKAPDVFAPILSQESQQAQPDLSRPVAEKSPSSNQSPTKGVRNFMHIVTLQTNFGEIQFETYDADAPKAAQNFISLAQKGFYNNLIFHRVIPGFMIQGGDPKGDGTGGPGYQFEDELNPDTESYKNGYKKGVVAMANAGPNTNGSQFFIMLADYPLPNNYTIFGRVIKGQEVVDAIGKTPTGSQDRPQKPVIMKEIKVETK